MWLRAAVRISLPVLVATLTLPVLTIVSAAEPAALMEVPGEAAASAVAARQGRPVRVADKTSETAEVMANPDGTFTLSQSLRPVRVQRTDEWVPVDLTLVRRGNGSIGPAAAPGEPDGHREGGGLHPAAGGQDS